ncbi:Ribosomal protein [Parasponia andersonii]|uniref:Ribosomal protein n=1 Tax=Parasponia andersonii TaxID=3476 RepID=A0A2P5DB66_PARAD|nr:Ribosomal protein [Parasponia andersonii]
MAMAETTTPPRVSPKTVEKAVKALLKWRNSKSQIQKPQLLDEDEFVYLVLTLKKIPPRDRINAHKVPLPHSLLSESSELCLIIDDRSKSNLTKDDAAKKISSEGIPVSKVLRLSKLKSDYQPFESKRKLCDSYDVFLADKRVVPLLPRLLGKQFFKKKKIPVPVDLRHKNWKEQIERACGSALLFLRTGTCSVVRVAKASMGSEAIVENVVAAVNGIVEIVPRKWGNVRSFHVKLLESLALPIYQALPDTRLKIEGVKAKLEAKEEEEEGGKGVGKDEKAGEKMKKKKGRIHEVRYMDVSAGESSDEDELGGGDDDDAENDEKGSCELGRKKRKKGGQVKEDEVVEGKRLKKSAKTKGEDELSGVTKKKKKRKDDSSVDVIESGESGGRKEKKGSAGKLKSGETKLKAKKKVK